MKYRLVTINKKSETVHEREIGSIEDLWNAVVEDFTEMKRGGDIFNMYLYRPGETEETEWVPSRKHGWFTLSPGRIRHKVKHVFGHEIISKIRERIDGATDEEKALGQWIMIDILNGVEKEELE